MNNKNMLKTMIAGLLVAIGITTYAQQSTNVTWVTKTTYLQNVPANAQLVVGHEGAIVTEIVATDGGTLYYRNIYGGIVSAPVTPVSEIETVYEDRTARITISEPQITIPQPVPVGAPVPPNQVMIHQTEQPVAQGNTGLVWVPGHYITQVINGRTTVTVWQKGYYVPAQQ